MDELDDEAAKELGPDPALRGGVDPRLFVQMAYAGQNFDMPVPCPEGTTLDENGLIDLAERFHDQHEADRGFAFRSQQPIVRGRAPWRAATPPSPITCPS